MTKIVQGLPFQVATVVVIVTGSFWLYKKVGKKVGWFQGAI